MLVPFLFLGIFENHFSPRVLPFQIIVYNEEHVFTPKFSVTRLRRWREEAAEWGSTAGRKSERVKELCRLAWNKRQAGVREGSGEASLLDRYFLQSGRFAEPEPRGDQQTGVTDWARLFKNGVWKRKCAGSRGGMGLPRSRNAAWPCAINDILKGRKMEETDRRRCRVNIIKWINRCFIEVVNPETARVRLLTLRVWVIDVTVFRLLRPSWSCCKCTGNGDACVQPMLAAGINGIDNEWMNGNEKRNWFSRNAD